MDESGVNTYFQREYARAPRGSIIEDIKRVDKFERVNVIGALCGEEYYAIECYRHTANSEFFEAWLKDCLLAEIPEGCTIILDNEEINSFSTSLSSWSDSPVNLILCKEYLILNLSNLPFLLETPC